MVWNEIRREKGRFFRWLWATGQCCSTIRTVVKELQLLHQTMDQTIDDLIRTGFISEEQHWWENSGRSCLLFYAQGKMKIKKKCRQGGSVSSWWYKGYVRMAYAVKVSS